MNRGMLITLEGTEGVGKSSCIPFLQRRIESLGHAVVVTREPGGTALGEAVRNWILEGHRALSGEVELLLMFAARADHLARVIRPALTAGQWVLCDRFTDATVAYQGGGRGSSLELIAQLRQAVHGDLEPDLTLLLDAPLEIARARIADRPADHFERENFAFFERVRAAYLEIARSAPDRVHIVDASGSPAEAHAGLARELDRFLQARDKDGRT
jgi:dTMP kinase